jgi:hypothetical protein
VRSGGVCQDHTPPDIAVSVEGIKIHAVIPEGCHSSVLVLIISPSLLSSSLAAAQPGCALCLKGSPQLEDNKNPTPHQTLAFVLKPQKLGLSGRMRTGVEHLSQKHKGKCSLRTRKTVPGREVMRTGSLTGPGAEQPSPREEELPAIARNLFCTLSQTVFLLHCGHLMTEVIKGNMYHSGQENKSKGDQWACSFPGTGSLWYLRPV